MELLIFVIALGGVAFLATRFGYDSRASASSKEANTGAHGVTWAPHAGSLPDPGGREVCDVRNSDFSEPVRQEFGEHVRELVGAFMVTESATIVSRRGGLG